MKVEIGTFDRLHISNVYVQVFASIGYIECEDFDVFDEATHEVFKTWVKEQSKWHHKNWIHIFEHPECKNKAYKPSARAFTIQYYLKCKDDDVKDWRATVEELKPLAELLMDTIEETATTNGITFKKWKT